jgi:GT2 family glycosyltransferase
MNKLLLVITTYNQVEYTKLCFDSLKKVTDCKFDVLIIDDYSTDDTIDLCMDYEYEVIKKDKPMGLTHSWNLGYKRFKEDNYDHLIIANNDILIPNGSISELLSVFHKWPYTLVVPLTTTNGAGHNAEHQSIESHYDSIDQICNEPDNYQKVQDNIFEIKKNIKKSNNLYVVDPYRVKMFNGFFFMANRNVVNYEYEKDILFNPRFIMTKNEDEFNWSKLIPNNDYPAVCKTSFIYHFKGVSAVGMLRNNDKWKEERVKN